MSFEEIITMMENATDYIDLYDAASYIVDDDLRVDVEQLIGQCEDDGDDVETAYSVVTSDLLDMKRLELNESVELDKADNITDVSEYLDLLNSSSNDKDLLNVIDSMENNKNIDDELVANVRQLFRNNRFMTLEDKLKTITNYIQKYADTNTEKKIEHLTEAKENNENKEDVDEEDVNVDNVLYTLNAREGQQFSVAELNGLLQGVLSQPNKIFILKSDLSSMDLDVTQTLNYEDDDIKYQTQFDIIDMEDGIIELKKTKVVEE